MQSRKNSCCKAGLTGKRLKVQLKIFDDLLQPFAGPVGIYEKLHQGIKTIEIK